MRETFVRLQLRTVSYAVVRFGNPPTTAAFVGVSVSVLCVYLGRGADGHNLTYVGDSCFTLWSLIGWSHNRSTRFASQRLFSSAMQLQFFSQMVYYEHVREYCCFEGGVFFFVNIWVILFCRIFFSKSKSRFYLIRYGRECTYLLVCRELVVCHIMIGVYWKNVFSD